MVRNPPFAAMSALTRKNSAPLRRRFCSLPSGSSRRRTNSTGKLCIGYGSGWSHVAPATINQIRAFLVERGISFRKGSASLRRQMPEILRERRRQTDGSHAPPVGFSLAGVETSAAADRELRPTGGDGRGLGHRKRIGVSQGTRVCGLAVLVPRQWSTGGKPKPLGISKRGNPYFRKMFIHGARAAVLRLKREGSCPGQWM